MKLFLLGIFVAATGFLIYEKFRENYDVYLEDIDFSNEKTFNPRLN